MSATRLSNREKRLESVARRGVEGAGLITSMPTITIKTVQRALALSVAVWSILEVPIEVLLAQSSIERFASATGRLIWITLALGTIFKIRVVKAIFIFLCAVSSIVVALALPMAYKSSLLVFCVLMVDFLLKVLTLVISAILTLVAPHSR